MATLIVLVYLCHADIIDRTTFQRFFAFQMATSIVCTYLPLLSSLYANIDGTIVKVRNRIYGNSYFRARQAASGRLDIKKTFASSTQKVAFNQRHRIPVLYMPLYA
jgi:hypothetical protein